MYRDLAIHGSIVLDPAFPRQSITGQVAERAPYSAALAAVLLRQKCGVEQGF